MNTNPKTWQNRSASFTKGTLALIALLAPIGLFCPPLFGQGTLAVACVTNGGSATQITLYLGFGGDRYVGPDFSGPRVKVLVSTNDIGRIFPITQAQDTNFNAVVAALTNGTAELFWTGYCVGEGCCAWAAPESIIFRPLPVSGNGVDFEGFHIDNLAFQLDAMSPGVGFRIFVNSEPVPGSAPNLVSFQNSQTAELGSTVVLKAEANGFPPLTFLWFFNDSNLVDFPTTSSNLFLNNVQLAQSGGYSLVVTNPYGSVTSPPALLNVIAPVERRPVPGLRLTGEVGSLLNLDYVDSLAPAPNWNTVGSVRLNSTSQYWFELTLPLPPQRFYRVSQAGIPSTIPSLDLSMVPAITLTGNIGDSVRLDYITRFGPTDAWVTLEKVMLTNTSQLYFDVSAPGAAPRLYRLVPTP